MKVGSSFTAVTTMVKVCTLLVSTPGLVPPLSWICTETTAEPFRFPAGVKVSVPVAEIAGCVEKRALLSLEMSRKSTACPASSAGPGEIDVAHPATVVVPLSSSTV